MQVRWFLIISVLWLLIQAAHGQMAYYVERDGLVQPITRGHDPEKEHPYQWQVRLYPAARPKTGAGWGEIIGQSAEDVMQGLQRSRDVELRLAKFCKCDSQN